MIASPITGLVRGLNALIAGLAIQLGQIVEQGLLPGGRGARGGDAARSRRRGGRAEAEEAAAEERRRSRRGSRRGAAEEQQLPRN